MPLTRLCRNFLLCNFAIFLLYRLIFLWRFADPFPSGDVPILLLFGARIDAPLLGAELFLFVLLMHYLRLGRKIPPAVPLWGITGAHILYLSINFIFYAERNQDVGEMLIAFAMDPAELYLGVGPFVRDSPATLAFAVIGVTSATVVGFRAVRRADKSSLPSFAKRDGLVALVIASLLGLAAAEPVRVKFNRSPFGWQLSTARARNYMRFSAHTSNQAIVNPLYKLLVDQIPAAARSSVPYVLPEGEAVAVCRELLGLSDAGPYTLQRTIRSDLDLGLRNLVLIQVEGMTASLLDEEIDGTPVTPFMRRLRSEGLYFKNTFQSWNDTVGSVFATATGVHKACFEQQVLRLTTYEMDGCYATVPRLFPDRACSHFFFEGFRQSATEFVRFMGGQSYQATGYLGLSELVRGKDSPENLEGGLGVHDGPVLREVLRTALERGDRPFTAHLMTGTSHSPWETPADFPRRFESPALNSFAYFDSCLEEFFTEFRRHPEIYDRTLFVVFADHTSVTLGSDPIERIRIPLVFVATGIDRVKARFEGAGDTYASHVDIVPTALDLLGGERPYAGMGQSLLRSAGTRKGAISGCRGRAFYLRPGYVLEYTARADGVELMEFDGVTLKPDDVSTRYPEVTKEMLREYLAQCELARRLGVTKRIIPPP